MTTNISTSTTAQSGFYDLKSKTIDGKDFSFSSLKGKKILIVNTASKCGHTPQYEDLEKLFDAINEVTFEKNMEKKGSNEMLITAIT